ncbi:hypothetical protein H1R20_g2137, partial [Candolleomyces eurysporus]
MASSNGSVKILTVGSAVGSIRELFAKVKVIDAKHGKFDLLLCAGDFFGPLTEDDSVDDEVSQLLEGRIEAPIESYIMQGDQPLPGKVIEKFAKTGGELCKNVFLMSTLPLDDVVAKIKPRYHFAAAGGRPPKFWEREPFVWDGEDGRISRFISLGAFGNEPATGKKQRWFYAFSIAPISATTAPAPKPANATKNPFMAGVAKNASKRSLEEAAENFIWGAIKQPTKRSKVVPQGEPGKPPPGYKCRRCESTEHFISDCPERQKPPENYVCKICGTPGHFVRDCPTRDAVGDTGGKKPKPGYVCRACGSENHYLEDCLVANQQRGSQSEHRGRRGPPKEISTDECWFCLSNPNLAKHLIVSIGSECYVTLAKGQIIPTHSEDYTAQVPGGGHILIVPITHYPTFSTIPSDIAQPILDETER